MGDELRLSQVGPSLTLREPDYDGEAFQSLTLTSSGADRRRRAARLLAGDEGPMANPGELRLSLDASAYLPGAVPTSGLSDWNDPTPLTAGLRPTGAAGGVSLRGTFQLSRASVPASDAATAQVELAVLGSADLREQGVHAMAQVARDALALRGVLERSYQRVAALQAWLGSAPITRLQELAALQQSRGLTAEQIAEANGLIEGLLRELPARSREVRSLLGTGRSSVDQALDIMDRLEAGADRAGASLRVRVGGEVGVAVRTPTVRFGPGDRLGVDLAARIAAIIPGQPIPEELRDALQGLENVVTLRSTMVAVRGYVAATVGSYDGLRQRLNEVRDSLGGLLETANGAQRLLGGLVTGETSGAEETLRALESQAEGLEASAQELMQEFQPVITSGIEIDQADPTGGLALDELRARLRYTDTSFEAALSLYVQHVAGILPGTRTRVTFGADGQPRATAEQSLNVYESLFPRLYGGDLSLAFRRDSDTGTRVMGGAVTDGRAVTAHLGLVQQLGARFLVRLGIVDPDLLATEEHTLIPTAGAQIRLGANGDEDAFTIDLNGGAELRLTGETPAPEGAFSLPSPLVGGSASLTLTGRFGR